MAKFVTFNPQKGIKCGYLGHYDQFPLLDDATGSRIKIVDGVKNEYGYPYDYKEHLGIVKQFVFKLEYYTHNEYLVGTSCEELIQEGLLILLKAWFRFNNRGSLFYLFANQELVSYLYLRYIKDVVQKPRVLRETSDAYLLNRVPASLEDVEVLGTGINALRHTDYIRRTIFKSRYEYDDGEFDDARVSEDK